MFSCWTILFGPMGSKSFVSIFLLFQIKLFKKISAIIFLMRFLFRCLIFFKIRSLNKFTFNCYKVGTLNFSSTQMRKKVVPPIGFINFYIDTQHSGNKFCVGGFTYCSQNYPQFYYKKNDNVVVIVGGTNYSRWFHLPLSISWSENAVCGLL